ncbi:GNAT family N-acetyltransferase [Deinococcus aerophilus]|uniref:GNAT family N-acetyltransferase n=1 Tax=Deinococcus aerophilus TaxID=522488 RepID=UPI001669136B|nr:GNAT family protein [Deinococcus aerophilus]
MNNAAASEVRLRSLRSGDEESAVRWGADEAFCRAVDWPPGLSAAHLRAHWQDLIAATEPDFLRLGIERGGRLVGYTDLAHITDHGAEFGIAIGERTLWGSGVGTAAGQQTLTHAFGPLGLRRVHAEVHLPNLRSHALMRRLGFRELGRAGAQEYQGQIVPVVRYRLDRVDFTP